jgi:hypothetical protein
MKARAEAAADEAHAQTLLPERLMSLTHADQSNPRLPVGIVSFRQQAAKAVCKIDRIKMRQCASLTTQSQLLHCHAYDTVSNRVGSKPFAGKS